MWGAHSACGEWFLKDRFTKAASGNRRGFCLASVRVCRRGRCKRLPMRTDSFSRYRRQPVPSWRQGFSILQPQRGASPQPRMGRVLRQDEVGGLKGSETWQARIIIEDCAPSPRHGTGPPCSCDRLPIYWAFSPLDFFAARDPGRRPDLDTHFYQGWVSSVPTGLRFKAPGCEARATRGRGERRSYLEEVVEERPATRVGQAFPQRRWRS
jgi:hypothetical protein